MARSSFTNMRTNLRAKISTSSWNYILWVILDSKLQVACDKMCRDLELQLFQRRINYGLSHGGVLMLKKSEISHLGVKWTADTEDWQILAIFIHWLHYTYNNAKQNLHTEAYDAFFFVQNTKSVQFSKINTTKTQFAAKLWSLTVCNFFIALRDCGSQSAAYLHFLTKFLLTFYLWGVYSELQEDLVHCKITVNTVLLQTETNTFLQHCDIKSRWQSVNVKVVAVIVNLWWVG